MALTLEAVLVFPLAFSLILGLVPPAVRDYRRIARAATALRQGVRLNANPASLYQLAQIPANLIPDPDPGRAVSSPAAAGTNPDVLLTSPKLMFNLVTAVLDDLEILGLKQP